MEHRSSKAAGRYLAETIVIFEHQAINCQMMDEY
jgi:hypothetical protein